MIAADSLRRPCRLAIFALALIASLLPATVARAQGTYGQLPDPISSAELSRLLTRYVHPTQAQGVSVEALHDAYRERFRALREGDIERFLVRTRQMQGGTMPSKEQVEEFTRGYERIARQIAEVDEALFDAVAALMGEERVVAVKRANDARARDRNSSGLMRGMVAAGPAPDLSAIVLDSKPSASQVQSLEPLLVPYEQRMTAATKELGVLSVRMFREMFEAMEKAGLGNLSQEDLMEDPEKAQETMQKIQAAMQQAGERAQAKAKEIVELNNKTYRAIAAQLTGTARRQLRARYLSLAYPEVATDPVGAELLFLRALRVKSLDAAGREQVQGAYERWQAADDPLAEQLIKLADEARAGVGMMALSGDADEDSEKVAEKIAELTAKRTEVGTEAMKPIAALLGDERLQKLLARGAGGLPDAFDETGDPEADAGAQAAASGAGAAIDEDLRVAALAAGAERQAIGVELVAWIAAQLALDQSRAVVLDSMQSDYLGRWEEQVRPIEARIEQARGSQFTADATGARVDGAATASLYEARKAHASKAAELDAAFFQDLGHALGEAAGPTLRMARLERALEGAGGTEAQGSAMMMRTPALPVNFMQVLRESGLPPEELSKARLAIDAQVEPLLKLCLESALQELDFERELLDLGQRTSQLYQNNEAAPDMAKMQQLTASMAAVQQRQSESAARRSEAVLAAWKSVLQSVGDGQRDALTLAYDERAFPSVFKDPRCATPYIQKARRLGDLTSEQQLQLKALDERYRAEHVGLCRKMVPKADPAKVPAKPEEQQQYWQQQMEAVNACEKIRFDRDEGSQRAISQLRRILTEGQQLRLPGLEGYERAAAKEAQELGELAE